MNKPSPLNPPTLRNDKPLYPHLTQCIRVTSGQVSGPVGVAQIAGSSVLAPILYVAFTQQMRTDGSLLMRDREPCLAADINGAGLAPGFHLGRLAGSHSSLPVYEVTAQGPVGSIVGVQGPQGAQGDAGPKGSTGDPGTMGTPGPRGSTGDPGTQGTPGAPGPTGSRGDPGTQGGAGPTGSRGDPGTQGSPGPKGDTGATGATGATGPAGSCGPCGSTAPSLICSLLMELPGYNGAVQQIVGHAAGGTCQWFDVEECPE